MYKLLAVIISIFFFTYLAIHNSFNLAFSGDDWLMHYMTWSIFDLRHVTSIWNPLAWLTTYGPHWPTLAFIKHFWGFSPTAHYTISWLLRGLVAVTIYWFLNKQTGNKFLAYIAAIFFGVNYLGIETTDWSFNFIHYAGISVAVVFFAFYYKAKDTLKFKDKLYASLLFLLALIVSPPRMHGLFPLAVVFEVSWFLIEGKKYDIKHALIRVFLLFFFYRLLFVSYGDLTVFLKKYGIDISAAHPDYAYGDPGWTWSRIMDGYAIAMKMLSEGRTDFFLNLIITLGNYVFPDALAKYIPTNALMSMYGGRFGIVNLILWVLAIPSLLGWLTLKVLKTSLSFRFNYAFYVLLWGAVVYFVKKNNYSTLSDNYLIFALLGGLAIIFTLFLFYKIKNQDKMLAHLLLLSLGWMVTFSIFPWLLEPYGVIASWGRYSIQQAAGLSIWVALILYLVRREFLIDKRAVSMGIIYACIMFFALTHLLLTNNFLAGVMTYRSREIDKRMWDQVHTIVPEIDRNSISVFFLLSEPSDYLIAEWDLRFPFPPRATFLYNITDEKYGPFLILNNYDELLSSVTDGERLIKQGRPPGSSVTVDHVYAFYLRDKTLTDITPDIRQKLRTDIKDGKISTLKR